MMNLNNDEVVSVLAFCEVEDISNLVESQIIKTECWGILTKKDYLLQAAEKRLTELVKSIVKSGVDRDLTQLAFRYAFQVANNEDVIRVLLKTGDVDNTCMLKALAYDKENKFDIKEKTYDDYEDGHYTRSIKLLLDSGFYFDTNKLQSEEIDCTFQCLGVWACDNNQKEFLVSLLGKQENVVDDGFHTDSVTFLGAACYKNHIEIVRILLGTVTLTEDEKGGSLVVASEKGYSEIVGLLLEAGTTVVYRSRALSFAAENGHVEVVRLLLAAGVMTSIPKRGSALLQATYGGNTEVVRLLLTERSTTSNNRDGVLIVASENGYAEIVSLILTEWSTTVEMRDKALLKATKPGYTEIVKLLLEAGTSVKGRYSALRTASECGHIDIVKHFTETRAVTKDHNCQILLTASSKNHTNIVQVLLESDFTTVLGRGDALIDASKNCHTETMKLLLGAGITAGDRNYALLVATQKSHFPAINLLLERGDVSVDGVRQALNICCKIGCVDSAKLLIKASTNFRAEVGASLRVAVENNNLEVVKVLLNAGDVQLQL